jgi:hypothetical protein
VAALAATGDGQVRQVEFVGVRDRLLEDDVILELSG